MKLSYLKFILIKITLSYKYYPLFCNDFTSWINSLKAEAVEYMVFQKKLLKVQLLKLINLMKKF